MRAVIVDLFLDAGLAVFAYAVARLLGYSPFVALIAGTVVAGLRVVSVVVRRRKVDPFAVFMMAILGSGSCCRWSPGARGFCW